MENFRFKTPEELQQQEETVRLQRELEGKATNEAYEEKLETLRTIKREHKTSESLTEEMREKTDSVIEQALFEGSFIGAGKDAVVLKLQDNAFAPDIIPILKEQGLNFSTEIENPPSAAKILKIYEPGKGVHEYTMQRDAYNILSQEENAAQVPNPIGIRDQKISYKDREYLNGFGTHLDNNMEVVIMDFIEGKDLATIMYEFVLKAKGYEEEEIENMQFEDKANLVSKYLGFSIPGGKDRDDTARAFELAATMNENSSKLFKYLKQKGFMLKKEVVEKIENSLKILARNNIHHNDMHERNIMIDKDGEPYIIDFGRSTRSESEENNDDMAPVRRWKNLTTTFDEDTQNDSMGIAKEMELKEISLRTNQKWNDKAAKIKSVIRDGNIIRLANEFIAAQSSEIEIDNFLILAKKMLHDKDLSDDVRTGIHEFVISIPHSKTPLYAKNKVTQVIKSGWLA
jgi:serine/threonine protein kinase